MCGKIPIPTRQRGESHFDRKKKFFFSLFTLLYEFFAANTCLLLSCVRGSVFQLTRTSVQYLSNNDILLFLSNSFKYIAIVMKKQKHSEILNLVGLFICCIVGWIVIQLAAVAYGYSCCLLLYSNMQHACMHVYQSSPKLKSLLQTHACIIYELPVYS